jgi:hypothetical protein
MLNKLSTAASRAVSDAQDAVSKAVAEKTQPALEGWDPNNPESDKKLQKEIGMSDEQLAELRRSVGVPQSTPKGAPPSDDMRVSVDYTDSSSWDFPTATNEGRPERDPGTAVDTWHGA